MFWPSNFTSSPHLSLLTPTYCFSKWQNFGTPEGCLVFQTNTEDNDYHSKSCRKSQKTYFSIEQDGEKLSVVIMSKTCISSISYFFVASCLACHLLRIIEGFSFFQDTLTPERHTGFIMSSFLAPRGFTLFFPVALFRLNFPFTSTVALLKKILN